jgi:hypothetical protein
MKWTLVLIIIIIFKNNFERLFVRLFISAKSFFQNWNIVTVEKYKINKKNSKIKYPQK